MAEAGFRREERGGEPENRRTERDHEQANADAEQDGTGDMQQAVARVLGADGLGGEPRRADAQEISQREDDVEQQRAEHQPAQQARIAQPPDDRDIDNADQRLGDEGHRGGQGDLPHIGVVHGKRMLGTRGRHKR